MAVRRARIWRMAGDVILGRMVRARSQALRQRRVSVCAGSA